MRGVNEAANAPDNPFQHNAMQLAFLMGLLAGIGDVHILGEGAMGDNFVFFFPEVSTGSINLNVRYSGDPWDPHVNGADSWKSLPWNRLFGTVTEVHPPADGGEDPLGEAIRNLQQQGIIDQNGVGFGGIFVGIMGAGLDATSGKSPTAKFINSVYKALSRGSGFGSGSQHVPLRLVNQADIGGLASFLRFDTKIITNGSGGMAFAFGTTSETPHRLATFNANLANVSPERLGDVVRDFGRMQEGWVSGPIHMAHLIESGVLSGQPLRLEDIEANLSFWAFAARELNLNQQQTR